MRAVRKSISERIVKVDPALNRPANADESVPEALVPDVIRADVQRSAPDTPQTRWQRIAQRAYELAQQRGFAPGADLSDWLRAEQEIDAADQQIQAAPENQITG
ncbi:DUF2934 domain-containing protein [Steroidobacter flavus]|uniref:DUF2934 domain-containing protein n=1 Tax=Steroidobacter flavus TaxID=1842136 RepID=A0ABV8SN89_9GAMM